MIGDSIDPLRISTSIQNDYERYIQTTFPLRNPILLDQFREYLQKKETLVKGPFIEATPPFKFGKNIKELIEESLLCKRMTDLNGRGFPDPGYPIDRPLYLHQEQAIRKLKNGRNVIVATGTGSGKTESFLLPIIDSILRENEAGTLQKPGIRALLLYPMNALANDQLKRLRMLLKNIPEVTFGRYTGQTQEDLKTAEEEFMRVFPDEPRVENELISREQIRENPPHLLLTNYAMLEFLLLRPKDISLFEGAFSQSWSFIVLDEAHSYSGAAGMEVGMLLRRLKDRVAHEQKHALQCIATSATLGAGKADFPQVAEFGKALFDETFQWLRHDETCQDIIEPTIQEEIGLKAPWGKPEPGIYEDLLAAPDCQTMADIALKFEVPVNVIEKAKEKSDTQSHIFLYHLLQGDQRVQTLKMILKNKPSSLEEAATAENVFGEDGQKMLPALVNLISLCIKAVPGPDAAPLISARYHLFCRALAGAFVTFPSITADPVLHLEEVDRVEQDGIPCQAFEIASCRRCGQVMISGSLVTEYSGDSDAQSEEFLKPLRPIDRDISTTKKMFLSWGALPRSIVDEDESALADAEPMAIESNPGTLCAGCGAFKLGKGQLECRCGAQRHLVVYEAPRKDKDERLSTCPVCAAQTPYEDIVHGFYTGQDAPVAVLATSLYQHVLPESNSDRPGESRKLLTFSDSRQDAAFFAPYLEATHQSLMHRCLIHTALQNHVQSYGLDPARPHGLAKTFLKDLSRELKLFSAPTDPAREHQTICTWIFQELLTFEKRLSLEGTGLLAVRYTKPPAWKPPAELLLPPWDFSEEESWTLIESLLDSLRFSGCLSIEPADITAVEFEPRNRMVYCRQTGGEQSRGLTVLSCFRGAIIVSILQTGVLTIFEEFWKKRAAMSYKIRIFL